LRGRKGRGGIWQKSSTRKASFEGIGFEKGKDRDRGRGRSKKINWRKLWVLRTGGDVPTGSQQKGKKVRGRKKDQGFSLLAGGHEPHGKRQSWGHGKEASSKITGGCRVSGLVSKRLKVIRRKKVPGRGEAAGKRTLSTSLNTKQDSCSGGPYSKKEERGEGTCEQGKKTENDH